MAPRLLRRAYDARVATQSNVHSTIVPEDEYFPELLTQLVRQKKRRLGAAGHVMVFKVYRDIGYVLVMEATQPIHIHDTIRNPI